MENFRLGTFHRVTGQNSLKLSKSWCKRKKGWDCHGPEGTRETWQRNAVWYAGLNLGNKGDINGKTGEIQIESEV